MGWRQIHSSVATSESLSAVSSDAERLFWRMLAQTDPWGRLPGGAAKVRALCCPMIHWRTEHVDNLLGELEGWGRIIRYGETCQLMDFEQHQPIGARRRGFSKFPSPPDNSRSLPTTPGVLGTTPAESKGRVEEKKAFESPSESFSNNNKEARPVEKPTVNFLIPARDEREDALTKIEASEALYAAGLVEFPDDH